MSPQRFAPCPSVFPLGFPAPIASTPAHIARPRSMERWLPFRNALLSSDFPKSLGVRCTALFTSTANLISVSRPVSPFLSRGEPLHKPQKLLDSCPTAIPHKWKYQFERLLNGVSLVDAPAIYRLVSLAALRERTAKASRKYPVQLFENVAIAHVARNAICVIGRSICALLWRKEEASFAFEQSSGPRSINVSVHASNHNGDNCVNQDIAGYADCLARTIEYHAERREATIQASGD